MILIVDRWVNSLNDKIEMRIRAEKDHAILYSRDYAVIIPLGHGAAFSVECPSRTPVPLHYRIERIQ